MTRPNVQRPQTRRFQRPESFRWVLWISLCFLVGTHGFGSEIAWADSSEELPEFELGGRIGDDPEPARFADKIVVEKGRRLLRLYSAGEVLAEYEISLGSQPEGPKRQLGDGRTPEGVYRIDYRKRDSDYYRALHVSYPNALDRKQAAARGVRPGGAIMIHGLPNGLGIIGQAHLISDWTDGCIAVTNEEMDELWSLVRDGVSIELYP